MNLPKQKCAPAQTGAHRNLAVEHIDSAASSTPVKNAYPKSGDARCLNAEAQEMKLAFRAYEDALRSGDSAAAEAARDRFTRLAISVRRRTPRSLLAHVTATHQFEMSLPPPSAPDAAESRIANLDRERRTGAFYRSVEGGLRHG